MSNEVRIGGVTARFNEDGTLYLYQPDSNRALSVELAEQLSDFLVEHIFPVRIVDGSALPHGADLTDTFIHTRGPLEGQPIEPAARSVVLFDSRENLTPLADVAAEFDVDLTDTEREADKNAAESKAPAEPTLKQLRAAAAGMGVSPAGSKAQIVARMQKRGITGPGL